MFLDRGGRSRPNGGGLAVAALGDLGYVVCLFVVSFRFMSLLPLLCGFRQFSFFYDVGFLSPIRPSRRWLGMEVGGGGVVVFPRLQGRICR